MVDGSGTALTKPDKPTRAPAAGDQQSCFGLLDKGFSVLSCVPLGGGTLTAVGLVETSPESAGLQERTLLWTVKGEQASLALRRVRQLPGGPQRFADEASAQGADFDASGVQQAVVFTTPGPGGTGYIQRPLATLDVATSSGTVALHRDLHGGVARQAFGGRGIEVYSPRADGKADHGTFRLVQQSWRLVASDVIPSDRVPIEGLL